MIKKNIFGLVLLTVASASGVLAGNFRAGAAKIAITPAGTMWLNGYASRETPATGVIHDLWAKALVIEESKNNQVIFVTTDLLGLSHEIVESVFRQLAARYGINRSQLIMNASHTHSGPVVWPCLDVIFNFNVSEQALVVEYSRQLTLKIIEAVDNAMSKMVPATISAGNGQANFAVNRRNLRDHNSKGSTDKDVLVLRVARLTGEPLAVLFGYACHNTTIVDDNYFFNGDYAGFAQLEVEKNNPGAVGLFLMGCGGDQNPEPRGTVALAKKYGLELADAVQTVVKGSMSAITASPATSFTTTSLAFRPFELARYQEDARGNNKFLQRRANLMLEAYNKGWQVDQFRYPVQALRFGNELTILALSGETVLDYSIRAKRMFSGQNIFVAGYCNEVTCYIPSLRVLKEGGYEADESMIYYGLPGPFANDVEERIFTAIRSVMQSVGAKATTLK